MAIQTEEIEEVQGFIKEIDQGAMSAILDNLQMYQYEHPQRSTIRELVSNGIDAVKEKQIALDILSGRAKVEDHYVQRKTNDFTKDSVFDPGYYDINFLSGNDQVTVTYMDGGTTGKDKLIITDNGVGLGGSRVEGYFKIGYSTKRNTKDQLGKYGLGSKAGLSAAPYYTMTSRYNGREYKFMVYSHRIVPIVPKFDTKTGQENGIHLFSNNAAIYYHRTTLCNGVTIEIESKKHHKQLYIDAVKSQLLYFDNVVFKVVNDAGQTTEIPIKANVIYEDEHILLSDNKEYSKPHLLISRVNYGYVDFRELELEDVMGNIGFKVASEDVEIKPSRESVVWNDKTRATIMDCFHKVKATAEVMITEQLKVEDFVEWLEACSKIQVRYGTDSIIGRLSRLVNMDDAKIRYVKDAEVLYGNNLFAGIEVRVNELEKKREGSTVKYKIRRSEFGVITALADGYDIYIQQGSTSFRIDKFLLMRTHKDRGFITVKDPFATMDDRGEVVRSSELSMLPNLTADAIRYSAEHKITTTEALSILAKLADRVMRYLIESRHVRFYNKVEVPEDFNAKEEVEDEKTQEEAAAKNEREKERRAKGVIPIFTPRVLISSYISEGDKLPKRLYEFQKLEMPVADIDSWDEEEVFFGNEDDVDTLMLAAMITRPRGDRKNPDALCWSAHSAIQASWGDAEAGRRRFFEEYFDGYVNIEHSNLVRYSSSNSHLDSNNSWVRLNGKVPEYGVGFDDLARCHNFFRTDGQPRVKLIKVAKERVKFFLDFKHINRFFMDIRSKTLTMSNALIRWNTARLIAKDLHKVAFLKQFDRFQPKYAAWYKELSAYVRDNGRPLEVNAANSQFAGLSSQSYNDLVTHLDKLGQFQLFVRESNDPVKIAELAREMFNPQTEITDGLAIEIDKYDKLKELLDFGQPIATLLNEVGRLTGGGTSIIPDELETEIRGYCATKGVEL